MATDTLKTQSPDWPEPSRFRKSIRWEFSLLVSGIILLLMLTTGYVITDRYVTTVTHNIVDKLLVQLRAYSGSAGKLIIASDGPDALLLGNVANRIIQDNPDIYWAGITDNSGSFVAHTDIRQVVAGAKILTIAGLGFSDLLQPGETSGLRGDTIFIVVPVRVNDVEVGNLAAAASTRQIEMARNGSIIAVASITIIMLLLGLPFTTPLLHRRLRPIRIITDRLRQVNPDQFDLSIPPIGNNELGYLAETLTVMGTRLNLAQKELIEKQRVARELEIAREIQTSILPRNYPRTEDFEFFGTYRSALEVGGDYYDFIDLDQHRTAFLVADVSGKSLPGMLVMLLTRDLVKKLSRLITQPADLLCQVNRELSEDIRKGMFVTMFYGVLDSKNGRFEFASAGHNPLIHVRAGDDKVELIKTNGFPLGMMPPAQFDSRIKNAAVTLEHGDWLVQFTDGINEAKNSYEEEYGMSRFVDLLLANRNLDPETLVKETLAEHDQFVGDAPQFDDITLLVMKWKRQNADMHQYNIRDENRVNAN